MGGHWFCLPCSPVKEALALPQPPNTSGGISQGGRSDTEGVHYHNCCFLLSVAICLNRICSWGQGLDESSKNVTIRGTPSEFLVFGKWSLNSKCGWNRAGCKSCERESPINHCGGDQGATFRKRMIGGFRHLRVGRF